MWSRAAYSPEEPYVEEHFKLNTSSLIPGKPKVYPKIQRLFGDPFVTFELPSNVAKQDINTFVSVLFFLIYNSDHM